MTDGEIIDMIEYHINLVDDEILKTTVDNTFIADCIEQVESILINTRSIIEQIEDVDNIDKKTKQKLIYNFQHLGIKYNQINSYWKNK
jgi:hypothetical protein